MSETARYALVTGASSGIGECFARALAARRHGLVLVARSASKLEELAAELGRRQRIAAVPVPIDLGEVGAAARVRDILRERGIEVDLLVNNAGVGAQGEFWSVAPDRQSRIIQLNVQALVELSALFVPPMIQRREGAIINVSSTASFQPLPYSSTYAATKAFVTSFSTGIAEELRPYNVRVVTLCPGTTRTQFFDSGGYGPRRFRGGYQAPEKVAQAGLRALDRGGGLVLSRPQDRFLIFIERFLPRRWIARSAAGLFKP
jgi:uncharacterized protein